MPILTGESVMILFGHNVTILFGTSVTITIFFGQSVTLSLNSRLQFFLTSPFRILSGLSVAVPFSVSRNSLRSVR